MKRLFILFVFLCVVACLGAEPYYWTKKLGSARSDMPSCILRDSAGNIYVSGVFNMDTGMSNHNLTMEVKNG